MSFFQQGSEGKRSTFWKAMKHTGVSIAVVVGVASALWAVPAASVFEAPATVTSNETEASNDSFTVCVDWDSKVLKFSKYWEVCPSRHQYITLGTQGPQGQTGPRGFSGSSTTMWDSLSTCYQKLQAALQAGFIMAFKSDRDFFEASSGCIVEKISNESENAVLSAMGMPYISDWELVPVSLGGVGEVAPFGDVWSQSAVKYRIKIENKDALSATFDDNYGFCLFGIGGATWNGNHLRYSHSLQQVAGNWFENEHVTLRADNMTFTSSLTLGYKSFLGPQTICTPFISWDTELTGITRGNAQILGGHPVYEYNLEYTTSKHIVIHEDPAAWEGQATFSTNRGYWGW